MQEIVRSTRGIKSRRLKGKAKLNRKITLCIASIFCCLSFVAVGVLASLTDVSVTVDNDAYYYATAFNKNANDEFIIRTYDDLVAMSNLVNSNALVPDTHIFYKEAKFYLANDIDPVAEAVANGTSETDAKNATYPLSPIGKNSETAFSGKFRGDGHTISNITITLDSTNGFYGGLFGYTEGATITGVGLGTPEDVDTEGNTTLAKTCYFNYTPESTSMTMGAFGSIVGLAGHRIETLEDGSKTVITTTVAECYNYSNVTLNYSGSATIYLGGLVGVSTAQTEVTINVDNYDPARLDSWSTLQSGLVGNADGNNLYTTGYAPTAEITNCYNTGNVSLTGTATDVYASGIACNMPNTKYTSAVTPNLYFDLMSNYEYAKIRYCYNLGQVSGSEGKTSAISAGFQNGISTLSSTTRDYQNISRLATGVFALNGTGPEPTDTSTDFYKNITYLTLDEMSGEYCFTEVAGVDTTGKMAGMQNTISKEGESYSAYHETKNTEQMFKFPQLSVFEKITPSHPQGDLVGKSDSYNHYGIYKTVEIDNFHNFLYNSDNSYQIFMHSNRGGNTTTINHTTLGTSGFVSLNTEISEDCPMGENGDDIELNFKIDSTITISATPKSGFMFYGFALIKTPFSEDEDVLSDAWHFYGKELFGDNDEDDEENTENYKIDGLYRTSFSTYEDILNFTFIPNAESINKLNSILYSFFVEDAPTMATSSELLSSTNEDGTKTYTIGGDSSNLIYVRRGDDGEGYLEYNGETYYGIYAFYIPQVYSATDVGRLYTSDVYFNSDKTTVSTHAAYNVVTSQNIANSNSLKNLSQYSAFEYGEESIIQFESAYTNPEIGVKKGLLWAVYLDYWMSLYSSSLLKEYLDEDDVSSLDNYYTTEEGGGRLVYKEGFDPIFFNDEWSVTGGGIYEYDESCYEWGANAIQKQSISDVITSVGSGFYLAPTIFCYNSNFYGSVHLGYSNTDIEANEKNDLLPYNIFVASGDLYRTEEVNEFSDTSVSGSSENKFNLKVERFEGVYYGWNSARQVLSADDTDNNYLRMSSDTWAIALVLCDDGEGNPIFRMLGKDGTLSEEYFDSYNKFCSRYIPNETKLTLHMQVIDEAGNVVQNAVAKRNNQIAINGREWFVPDVAIYRVGVGAGLDETNPNKPTPPDQGFITVGESSWTYTICANSDFVLYADEYFGYNFDGFYAYSGNNPNDLSTGYTKIGNVEYNTETEPVTDDRDPTFARSKYWLQTEAGEVHIYCRYIEASIDTTIETVIGDEDDNSSFNLASDLAGFTGADDTFAEKIGYFTLYGINYIFSEDKTEIIPLTGDTTKNYTKFNKNSVATYSKIYFTVTARVGYKVEGLYLKEGITYTKIDTLTVTTKWDGTTTTYVINLAKEGFNVQIGGSAVSTTCETLYIKFAPDNPEVSVGTAYETVKDGTFGYADGGTSEGGYLNISGKISETSGNLSDSVSENLVGTVSGKGLSLIPLVNSYSGTTLQNTYTFTITALTSNLGYIFKGFYGLPTTVDSAEFLTSGAMIDGVVKITPNSTLTDSKGVPNQLICVNNNGKIALITDGTVGDTYHYIYAVFEREIVTIDGILDSGISSSSIGGGTLSADYAEYTKTDNAISGESTNKTQTTSTSVKGTISLPITITTVSPFAGIKQGSWVKLYISSVADGYRLAGYFPNFETSDACVTTDALSEGTATEGYVMYAQVGVNSDTSTTAYYTAHGTIAGYLYNFVKPSSSGAESIWVQTAGESGEYVTVEFVNPYTKIYGTERSFVYAKFEKTPLEDFMHVGKNDYNSLADTGTEETDFTHNADGTVNHTSTINTTSSTLDPELMGEAVVKYIGTTYSGTASPLNNANFTDSTYNENNINICNTFNVNASVGDLLEFYAKANFGFELVDAVALLSDGTTKVYGSSYFVETTLTSANNTRLNGTKMYKFLGNLPDAKMRVSISSVEISEKGDFTDTVEIVKFMFRFKPIDFNINFTSGSKDINGNEFIFYNEAKGEHNLGLDVIYYRGSTGGTAMPLAEYTETVDGETCNYLTGFDKKVATYATEGASGTLYHNNATGTDGNTGRGFFSAKNADEDYPSYIFVGWGVYGADGALSHAILLPQATPEDVYATALSTITERGLSHEIMDTTNFRLSAVAAQSAYEALCVSNTKNNTNSACITLQTLWFPLAYNDMEGRTYLVVHSTGDVMVGDTSGSYCNAQTWNTKGEDDKYIFKSVGYDRTISLEYGKPFILQDYWYLYGQISDFYAPYSGYELAGFNAHFDEDNLDSVQYTYTAQIYADGKNITISDVSNATSDSLLLSVVINGEAASSTDVNPFTTIEEIDGVKYKFIHLYAIFKKTVTYYVGTTDEDDNFLDTATGETSTLGSSFVENYYFGYDNAIMRAGGTQDVYVSTDKANAYMRPRGYEYYGIIAKEKLLTDGTYNGGGDQIGVHGSSNCGLVKGFIEDRDFSNPKTFPLSSEVNTEMCALGLSILYFNYLKPNADETGVELVQSSEGRASYKLVSLQSYDYAPHIADGWKVNSINDVLAEKYNIEFLGWSAVDLYSPTATEPTGLITDTTQIAKQRNKYVSYYYGVYKTSINTNFVAPVGSGVNSVTVQLEDYDPVTITSYTENASGERIFEIPTMIKINAGLMVPPEYSGNTMTTPTKDFYISATDNCFNDANYFVTLPKVTGFTFDSTTSSLTEKEYYTFGGWIKDTSRLSRVWDSTNGVSVKWYTDVNYNSKDSDGNYLEQGQESYYVEIAKETENGGAPELLGSNYDFSAGSSINLYPVFKYHEVSISNDNIIQNIFTEDKTSGLRVDNIVYKYDITDHVLRIDNHKFVLPSTLTGSGKYTGVYFVLTNTETTSRYINLNFASQYSTSGGDYTELVWYRPIGDSTMSEARSVVEIPAGATYEFTVQATLNNDAVTLSKFEFWPTWGTSADSTTSDLFVTGGKDDLSIALTTTVNSETVPICTLDSVTLEGGAEVWGNFFCLYETGDKVVINLTNFQAEQYVYVDCGGNYGVKQTGFKCTYIITTASGTQTTGTVTTTNGSNDPKGFLVASGGSILITLELTENTPRMFSIITGSFTKIDPTSGLFKSTYNYGAIREGENMFVLTAFRKNITSSSGLPLYAWYSYENTITGGGFLLGGSANAIFYTRVEEVVATYPAYFDIYYDVFVYYLYDDAPSFIISFNSTDETNETIYFNPSDGSTPQSAYMGTIPTTTYQGGQVSASYTLEDDSKVYKVGFMTATHSDVNRTFLGWYTEPTGGVKILDSEGKFNTENGCVAYSGYINSDGTWFGGHTGINLYAHFTPVVHKLFICMETVADSTSLTRDFVFSNPQYSYMHPSGVDWANVKEICGGSNATYSEINADANGVVTSYTVRQTYNYRVYYLEGDGYYLTYNEDTGTYTNKINKLELVSSYTGDLTPSPDRDFVGFYFVDKYGNFRNLTNSSGEISGLIPVSMLDEDSEIWGDVIRVTAVFNIRGTDIIIDTSTDVTGSVDTVGGGYFVKKSDGSKRSQLTFRVRQGGVSGSIYQASSWTDYANIFAYYTISRPAIFETEWGLEQLFYWDGSKAYTVYKNTNTSTDPSATPTLVLQKNVVTDGGLQITDANGNWVITESIVLYTEYRSLSKSAPIIMRVPFGVGDFTISNNTYGEIIQIQLDHNWSDLVYNYGVSYFHYQGVSPYASWYENTFGENIEVYQNGETKSLKYLLTGADDTTIPGISNSNYVERIRYKAVTSLTEGNSINITVCLIYTGNDEWVIAIFGLPETARLSEGSLRYSLTMKATNAMAAYTSVEDENQMMFSNPAINYVKSANNTEITYFIENANFSSIYISNTTSSMEFSTVYKSDNSAFLMKINTEKILIDVAQVLYNDQGELADYKIMGYFTNLPDAVKYFNANNNAHVIRIYNDITETSNTPIIIDVASRTASGMSCSMVGHNGAHKITFDSDYPITIIVNGTYTQAFQIYGLDIEVPEDATYSNEFIFDIKSTSTYAPERYFNFCCNIRNYKKGGGGVRADFSEQGGGYWIRFFGCTVITDGTAVLYKGATSARGAGGVDVLSNSIITSQNSYAIYISGSAYYLIFKDGSQVTSYSDTKSTIFVKEMEPTWSELRFESGAVVRSLGKSGADISCVEVLASLRSDSIRIAGDCTFISNNRGITVNGSYTKFDFYSFDYQTFNCATCDIYLGENSSSTPIYVSALDTSATLTPITIFTAPSISSFTVQTASATIKNIIKNNNLFVVSGVASITDSGSTNILYTLNALTIVLDRTLSGAPTTSDVDLNFDSVPILTFFDASGEVLGQTYLLEELRVYKLVLPLRKGSVSGDLVYATIYGTEDALTSPTIITVEGYTYVKTTDDDGTECYYCDINDTYLYESEDHQRVITETFWQNLYASQVLVKITIPSGCTKVQITVENSREVYTSSDLTAVIGSANTYTAQNGTIYLWWNDR